MGNNARNEKKHKGNGKKLTYMMGYALTGFNKFVIPGLVLMQNLMPGPFALKDLQPMIPLRALKWQNMQNERKKKENFKI